MHNDYLDPDRYDDRDEDDTPHLPDPPDMAWHLYRQHTGGTPELLGIFRPWDGQDVMGCDMHEWMLANDYYGDAPPDCYDWDGDHEYVAVASRTPLWPSFHFQWQECKTKQHNQT